MAATTQEPKRSKRDKEDTFYDADDDYEVRHKDGLLDDLGLQFGSWSTGLCNCWLSCIPNGCMSTLLPFVAMAQIASRMNMMAYRSALAVFLSLWALLVGALALEAWQTYESVVLHHYATMYVSWVWLLVLLLSYVGLTVKIMRLRAKVRLAFRIPGNVVSDFCLGCWCPPCTIAQMASHVQSFQPRACPFGPPDTLPAYF